MSKGKNYLYEESQDSQNEDREVSDYYEGNELYFGEDEEDNARILKKRNNDSDEGDDEELSLANSRSYNDSANDYSSCYAPSATDEDDDRSTYERNVDNEEERIEYNKNKLIQKFKDRDKEKPSELGNMLWNLNENDDLTNSLKEDIEDQELSHLSSEELELIDKKEYYKGKKEEEEFEEIIASLKNGNADAVERYLNFEREYSNEEDDDIITKIQNVFNHIKDDEYINFMPSLLDFIEKCYFHDDKEKQIIIATIEELLPIALNNKDKIEGSAVKAYDIFQELKNDIVILDFRLIESLLKVDRAGDADFLFDNIRDHYLQNGDIEDDDFPYEDRTGIGTNTIQPDSDYEEKYNILASAAQVKIDNQLVFIVKAISHSLLNCEEVRSAVFKKERKKDNILKRDLLMLKLEIILKEILEDIEIEDEVIEEIKNNLAEELNSVLRCQYLAFIKQNEDHLKVKYKEEKNSKSHFVFTEDHKTSLDKSRQGIEKCFSPLKSVINDNSLFKSLVYSFLNDLQKDYKKTVAQTAVLTENQDQLDNKENVDFLANMRFVYETSRSYVRRNAHERSLNTQESKESFGEGMAGGFTFKIKYINSKNTNSDSELKLKIADGMGVEYFTNYVEVPHTNYKKDIYEKLSYYINATSDKEIAILIRSLITSNKEEYKKVLENINKKISSKSRSEFHQFITNLTTLIMFNEGSRNYSTLIINQMMLDLIIESEMTFEDAFAKEKMPMSLGGAVKYARTASDMFRPYLPKEFRVYGDVFVRDYRSVETNPVLKLEDELIKLWLKKIKGKKTSEISPEKFCEIVHQSVEKWYPGIKSKFLSSNPSRSKEKPKQEVKSEKHNEQKQETKSETVKDRNKKIVIKIKLPEINILDDVDQVLPYGNLGMNHVSFLFQNLLQPKIKAGEDVARKFGRALIIQDAGDNSDLRTEIENFLVGQEAIEVHGAAQKANLDMSIGSERVLLLLNTKDQIPGNFSDGGYQNIKAAKYNHWTVLNLRKDKDGNLIVKYADSISTHDGNDKMPDSVMTALKTVCANNKITFTAEKFISTSQTALNCGYNAVYHALQMLNIPTKESVENFMELVKPTLLAKFNLHDEEEFKSAKKAMSDEKDAIKKSEENSKKVKTDSSSIPSASTTAVTTTSLSGTMKSKELG